MYEDRAARLIDEYKAAMASAEKAVRDAVALGQLANQCESGNEPFALAVLAKWQAAGGDANTLALFKAACIGPTGLVAWHAAHGAAAAVNS